MKKTISDEKLEVFMRESNWIEGERIAGHGLLYDNDLKGARIIIDGLLNKKLTTFERKSILLEGHLILFGGRLKSAGKFRTCRIFVGDREGESPKNINREMTWFFDVWDNFTCPTDLYIEYEKIHPFEDGNGRTGRLLWLVRALELDLYNDKKRFLDHISDWFPRGEKVTVDSPNLTQKEKVHYSIFDM